MNNGDRFRRTPPRRRGEQHQKSYPQIAQITQRGGWVLPVLAQPGVPNTAEANPDRAASASSRRTDPATGG
jgi:hypothetical protein